MKALWVWHPESPGIPVMVCRGFWARLFNPKHFATLEEVTTYRIYQAGLRERKPGTKHSFDMECG